MKQIKKLGGMLVLCFLFILGLKAQPQINKVEYYINTDPGYGLGIDLTFTPAANLSNLSFNLDISSYPIGITMVGVRSRDANGAWSHDNRWLIVKLPQQSSSPNITRTEYYLNTDPGYGNGTPVTISPTGTDGTGSFTIDITNQPIGITMVGVRSRDANGTWSHDNRLLIAKLPAENVSRTIKRLEYYIDSDPGYGNATAIAIPVSNNLPAPQINVNISGLASGKHYIFYRSLDTLGAWSHDNVDSFMLAAIQPAPVLVVNSINKNTFCAGDSLKIGYQVTGTYTGANTFKAFLSDANGSFTSEVEIGSITSISNGLIAGKLPSLLQEGTGYKVRIKSSTPALTGEASGNVITIHNRPTAQTITGINQVNGTYTLPYSVPSSAGSQWNWLPTGGIVSAGQNTNNASLTWSQPATPSVAGKINVVETNQYGCVGDTSTLVVAIYKLRIGNNAPATACKTDILNLAVTADGAYYAGNIYTAELSDAAGSFASAIPIGSINNNGSGVNQATNITATIPSSLPNGTGYRIRVRSSNPVFIGDSSANINILKPAIGPDLNRTKCDGYTYNLAQDFTDPLLTYNYYDAVFVLLPSPLVQAGIYNIIGTNANGCKDTALLTVTSNPSPNLGADTTVYHLCPGETTNLLPLYNTTGLTAAWNTGNPTAAVPRVYRLIVINGFGCPDTAYATITLEVATWVGSISNNWHTTANWNINKVPTDKTHVIIPTGTTNPCTISTADGIAASIQVKSGAVVNTNNNRQLIISGQCTTLPPN